MGIEEKDGLPVFPLRGIQSDQIDLIQRQIIGECRKEITPDYLPILFVEEYQEKIIIVMMVPAGDNRPYQAPKRDRAGRTYWVRTGAATVEATDDLLRQLLEQARKIPYDDRRSLIGTTGDISFRRVRRFLQDIRSHLNPDEFPQDEILRKLRLVVKINNHDAPRNVTLLFFSDNPREFFEGAYIEVVQFGDDAGGDLIEEKFFLGAIPDQIRACLAYLDGFGGALLQKIPGQAEVERTVPYPYESMEEAIVNAVYHRSYEYPPEPVKIYLYPDRMEITSYPGPVSGIRLEHLQDGRTPSAPLRNRRIGEFLKDLRLAEGRGTGIPKIQRKMKENGSPAAQFDFDEQRSYFRVVLPVHPAYQSLSALRESAHLWAIGEKTHALDHLKRAFEKQPESGAIVTQLIEYAFFSDEIDLALQAMDVFEKQERKVDATNPYLTLANLLIDRNRVSDAKKYLSRIPVFRSVRDTVEAALLKKRARDFQGAHRLFSEAYIITPDDPNLLQEFAQTKIALASASRKVDVKKRLNQESVELLRRAIQLTQDPIRQGWCWSDLARVLDWLKAPVSEVETAFQKARALLPDNPEIMSAYQKWKKRLC